jgi:hypothetical protein
MDIYSPSGAETKHDRKKNQDADRATSQGRAVL